MGLAGVDCIRLPSSDPGVQTPMALTYFKRYRMEIRLAGRDFSGSGLPPGYHLVAWDRSLLEAHAQVKYLSFRDEMDAQLFPCFQDLAGCHRLMTEIVGKPGFLPEATWLAWYDGTGGGFSEYCGTVQGLRDRSGMGAVQNVGILPGHRGRGVGTALLRKALHGFRQAGVHRVSLEVTAENVGAIRLYERLGFSVVKTVYKTAEVACS